MLWVLLGVAAVALNGLVPSSDAAFTAATGSSATLATSASFGLSQAPGTGGCISETGTAGACTDGKALGRPEQVAVSPDGTSVYIASSVSDAVAVFSRNASTGALTQLAGTAGCISETGTAGTCTDGTALDAAADVLLSPDGRWAYAASFISDAVAVFSRNTTTGALTQLAGTAGCISETGTAGTCTDGNALDGSYGIRVSADGTSVYVAAYASDAVAVISRNTTTGALTQLAGTAGCISETGTAGTCTDGNALDAAYSVVASPDGRNVYVSAAGTSDAVSVFSRDASTGALTQLAGTAGCTSETGTLGTCKDSLALDEVAVITLSGDGQHVYASATTSGAVSTFFRDPTTGELTQMTTVRRCISDTGTSGACIDGTALGGANAVAVSPDGLDVYVAAETSDAVVVLHRAR